MNAHKRLEQIDEQVAVDPADMGLVEEVASNFNELVSRYLDARASLSGSLARSTGVAPITDIDLTCTISCNTNAEPEQFFQKISAAFEDIPEVSSVIRGDAILSIELSGSPWPIDVLPLIKSGSGESIMFRKGDAPAYRAIRHNPQDQLTATEAKDTQTSGVYRPTARIFKHWNRQHDKVIPRSYLAECFVWYGIDRPTDYAQSLCQTFEFAARAILFDELGDPANLGDNVAANIPSGKRAQARLALRRDRLQLEALIEETDNTAASEELDELFTPLRKTGP